MRSLFLRASSLLLGALALAALPTPKAQAQTPPGLSVLYDFSDTYNSGQYPNGRLLADPAGFFYGVTYTGGVNNVGQLYKMTTSGSITPIHDFDPNFEGSNPIGTLAEDSSGNLYGVLQYGGSSSDGVIYKIDTTGTFNLLYTFTGGSTDGNEPFGGLLLGSDGKLYGTTEYGGTYGYGVVFTLYTDGSGYSLLHNFGASGDGNYPQAELRQGSGGYLYGTTEYGGANGDGTAFVLSTAGDGTLYQHSDFAGAGSGDGAYPESGFARDSSGTLYGTTVSGGGVGAGTIYKLVYSGGTLTRTTLYSFSGLDGAYPYGGLIVAKDSNLYGVTSQGGSYGAGEAYRYGLSGSSAGHFAALHSFIPKEANNTKVPFSQVSSGSDTNLYSVSYNGGLTSQNNTSGYGAAFKMTTAGTLTRLASFDVQSIYYSNASPLTQANDGYFYGTTAEGGAFGGGALYKTDAGGHVTVVHPLNDSASYTEGSFPWWGVTLAKDGSLYGVTIDGGAYSSGTLFRYIPSSSSFYVLHQFSYLEGSDPGPLLQGSDGNLYGVFGGGGGIGEGGVFSFNPVTRSFHVLYDFSETGPSGGFPYGKLFQDSNGVLYGECEDYGVGGVGTLWSIHTDGSNFNVLYSFSGTDGQYPYGGLSGDSSGNLYGVTVDGGANTSGIVFKFNPSSSTLTTLHAFGSGASDGTYPQAPPTFGSDGNLYGLSEAGGSNGYGTLYKVNTTGSVYSTLHSFTVAEGEDSYALVTQGSDANFYGTNNYGGNATNEGTTFSYNSGLGNAVDTSSTVSVTISGSGTSRSLTLKNTGSSVVLGPLQEVFLSLPSGVTVTSRTGTVPSGYSVSGKPYETAPFGDENHIFALAAGASVTFSVTFSADPGSGFSVKTWKGRF